MNKNLKNKLVFHFNNNRINLVLHTFQIAHVFLFFFKYSHLEIRVIKKLNYNKLLQIFLINEKYLIFVLKKIQFSH